MNVNVRSTLHGERGLVLATVLVFLLVLTISAFFASMLSRSDIQVVNNEQNEKQAFYVAEAGIAEALVRLGMTSATNVSVNSSTFDASLTGANAPDSGHTDWKAQILFSGSAPTKSGNTVTTPSIQPAATRLLYSTPSASAASLTLAWNLCAAAGPGCASAGAIRQAGGKNVLDIVSTGQSGAARRKVTLLVTKSAGLPSVLTSSTVCHEGISMNGSSSLNVSGSIQVNGACSDAVSGVGAATITAGGPINVVGGVSMHNAPTPTPNTGAPLMPDPLQNLLPPCFGLNNSNCQIVTPVPVQQGAGTPLVPVTMAVSSGTLSPGIYYGGLNIQGGTVTMNPGVYIMAGGGFSVSKNATTVNGTGGVVIYNTQDDNLTGRLLPAGQFGAFTASQNPTLNLTAPGSGGFQGVVLFQDRANTQNVSFQGGGVSGVIDGTVYALNSNLSLQGGTLNCNFIVYTLSLQGSPTLGPATTQPNGTGPGLSQLAWQDY